MDLNPQPPEYKIGALPLSYRGKGGEYIILNSPKRQILRHLAMAVLSYLCNI